MDLKKIVMVGLWYRIYVIMLYHHSPVNHTENKNASYVF